MSLNAALSYKRKPCVSHSPRPSAEALAICGPGDVYCRA